MDTTNQSQNDTQAEFDKIWGSKAPSQTENVANSRYDEIMKMADTQEAQKNGPYSTGNLDKIVKGTVSDLQKRGSDFLSGVGETKKTVQQAGGGVIPNALGMATTAGHLAGTTAGGVGDIIGNVAKPFIAQVGDSAKKGNLLAQSVAGLGDIASKGIGGATKVLNESAKGWSDLLQRVSDLAVTGDKDALTRHFQENPETVKGLGDLANTLALWVGEKTAKPNQDKNIVSTIDNHLTSAQQIVDSAPDAPLNQVLDRARINISDQLRDFYNKPAEAAKVANLNPADFSSLEDFSNAVKDVTNYEGRSLVSKTAGLVESGVQKGLSSVKPLVEKAGESVGDLAKAITSRSPEQVDAYILKKFEKGVKPSVAGQGTLAKAGAYQDKALTAVKSIVDNKPNLNIVDEFGESTGRLPQTLKQFADSIDQTKKQIFAKYDALQKTAGSTGASVDLTPAVSELKTIMSNPTIQDLHPDLAKYAESRATALEKRGAYTTQSAQDAITNLNNSLEAFYKNPSYETASRASVDAMIANKLRTGLDDVIEKTGGAGYQELKNQYGALKSIEKDVVKRSLIDARKNMKGLIDFSDIATGAEVIKGLATMNPATIATGLGGKAIAAYYKYLNNPNTAIKQLFNVAEKGGLSEPIPLSQQATKLVPESLPKTVPLPKEKINLQSGKVRNPFGSSPIPAKITPQSLARDFTDNDVRILQDSFKYQGKAASKEVIAHANEYDDFLRRNGLSDYYQNPELKSLLRKALGEKLTLAEKAKGIK